MKKLFVIFLVAVSAKAAVYTGVRNMASSNLTTSWTLLTTVTSPRLVRRIMCANSQVTPIDVSLQGKASDCSDAAVSWTLLASGNGNFATDGFPVGNYVCVKSTSGTLSSGIVQCLAWWDHIN